MYYGHSFGYLHRARESWASNSIRSTNERPARLGKEVDGLRTEARQHLCARMVRFAAQGVLTAFV